MSSIVGNGAFVADPEVLLDEGTGGAQRDASVARLASGGFVATWIDNGSVVAQVFDASGVKVGSEILIATSSQPPAVTGLAGGGFVVG